jgi:hypothetical protein
LDGLYLEQNRDGVVEPNSGLYGLANHLGNDPDLNNKFSSRDDLERVVRELTQQEVESLRGLESVNDLLSQDGDSRGVMVDGKRIGYWEEVDETRGVTTGGWMRREKPMGLWVERRASGAVASMSCRSQKGVGFRSHWSVSGAIDYERSGWNVRGAVGAVLFRGDGGDLFLRRAEWGPEHTEGAYIFVGTPDLVLRPTDGDEYHSVMDQEIQLRGWGSQWGMSE